MVSTRPLICKSSSPCTNPLVIVPCTPIRVGITVTFMFHSFFSSPRKSTYYLSICSLSVLPCGLPERQDPLFSRFSFFCRLSLGLVVRLFVSTLTLSWSLARPLTPFLYTCILSTFYLGLQGLRHHHEFLCSLVHLLKFISSPEYLTRDIAQVSFYYYYHYYYYYYYYYYYFNDNNNLMNLKKVSKRIYIWTC